MVKSNRDLSQTPRSFQKYFFMVPMSVNLGGNCAVPPKLKNPHMEEIKKGPQKPALLMSVNGHSRLLLGGETF